MDYTMLEVQNDKISDTTVTITRKRSCSCGEHSETIQKKYRNITNESLRRLDQLFNYSGFRIKHMFFSDWAVAQISVP